MLRILTLLLCLLGCSTVASGQAADQWATTVGRFSSALISGNRAAVEAALSSSAQVVRMDGEPSSQAQLLQHLQDCHLLGVHAYATLQEANIAADVADDCASDAVPADLKLRFVSSDDDTLHRADAIALRWVDELLHPAADEPVAVVVFWRSTVIGGSETRADPVFVLLRGNGGDGVPVVNQVVFGAP